MKSDTSPPQLSRQSPPSRVGRSRVLLTAAAVISLAALIGIVILRPGPFASHASSGTSRTAPTDKQVLRIVEASSKGGTTAAGDLNAIDPALIQYGGDYDKAQLVFPPLITLDDAGKPVDWAAVSHEVSSDGLTP